MFDNPRVPRLLSSRRVLDNPYFSVREDTITLPNGEVTTYIVPEPQNAVFMVATTEYGLYVLVRQFRHPIGRETLEIPAGMLPDGMDPLEQAQRELEEEVGCSAEQLELMATLQASPSRQDKKHYFIRARGLPDKGLNHAGQDHDEAINAIEKYSRFAVRGLIRSGQLFDESSITAFLLADFLGPYWS